MKTKKASAMVVVLVLLLSVAPLGVRGEERQYDNGYTAFFIANLINECPATGAPAYCSGYFSDYDLMNSLKGKVEREFNRFTDRDKANFLAIISTLKHFNDQKWLKEGTVDKYGEILKLAFDKADNDPNFRANVFSQYLGVYEDPVWSFMGGREQNLAKRSGLLYTQSVKDLVTDVLNDIISGKNKYALQTPSMYIYLIPAVNYIGYGDIGAGGSHPGDPAMLDLGKQYEAKISKCIDSDSGDNIYVKGSLSGTDLWENLILGQNDYCEDNRQRLIEKVCSGSSWGDEQHDCENGCVDGACVRSVSEPVPSFSPLPTPEISPEPSPTTRPKPASGVSIESALDLDGVKGQLTYYHISGIQSKVSVDYSTLTSQDKEFLLNLPEEISRRGLEKEFGLDDNIQTMIAAIFTKESDEESWIKSINSIGKLKGENAFNFLSYLLETKISGPAYYSDKVYDAVISAARENGDARLLRQIEVLNFVKENSAKDVLVESVNLCSGNKGSGVENECEGIYSDFEFSSGYMVEANIRNLGPERNFLVTTVVTDPLTGNLIRRVSKEIILGSKGMVSLTDDKWVYLGSNSKSEVKIEIRDFDGYKNVVSGKFDLGKTTLTTPTVNRYGILLSKSTNNKIESNIINPISGVHASIHLSSSTNNNIISNKISSVGSGHGILLSKGSNKNKLESNIISSRGRGSYGIYLKSSEGVTISNDVIFSSGSKDLGVSDAKDVKFVNVSVKKEKTSFEDKANLEVVNVLDVAIKDATTKEPIRGVKIEIKDNKGSKVVEESLLDGHRKNLELIKSKLNAVRDPTQKQVIADSTQITSEVRPIPPSMPLGGDSWAFLPEYQPGESLYEGGGLPIVAPEPMPPSDVLQHKSLIEENIPSGKRLSFQSNSPPNFTSTPITEAYPGVEYNYLVTATDLDAPNIDYLGFNKADGPDGLIVVNHFNGSATVKWTPSENQKGQTFPVSIEVDDAIGATNSIGVQNFQITVSSNLAPDITTDAPTSAIVNSEYRYSLIALDKDKDPLKITLLNGPTGFNLFDNTDGTATITWTPQSAGTYDVEIQVDDGKGEKNSKIVEKFTISVSAPGSVTDTIDEPVQPVKIEEDSPTYLLIAEAPGYETTSFNIDLSKMGSVELFLVKIGSKEQASSPVTAAPGGSSGSSESPSGSGSSSSSSFSIPPVKSVKPIAKSGPSLKVDRQLIDISAKVDGSVSINEIMPITNDGNKDLDVEVQVKGIDKLSVDTPKFKLAANEQKTIKLIGSISGLKLGTYTGKVIIKAGNLEAQEIKILLTVKQAEKEKLFDIVLDFDKDVTAFEGDIVDMSVKLVNVAGKPFDVKIRYRLKDFDGNTLSEETEEIKSSTATKNFVKNIKTEGIKPGSYVVEASIIEGQEEVAVAALTSYINGKTIAKSKTTDLPLNIILPIIIVIVVALVATKFVIRRKK